MSKKNNFLSWIILSLTSFILITNNLKAEVTNTIPVLSNQTTTLEIIDQIETETKTIISKAPVSGSRGRLKVTTSRRAEFPEVNLNEVPDEGLVTNGQIEQVIAIDSRRDSPGWSVTATCDNFVNKKSTEQIPISNLTIIPGEILSDDSIDGISRGESHTFINTDDPTLLMLALPGYGKGEFEQIEYLELFIDVATAPDNYSAKMIITIQ